MPTYYYTDKVGMEDLYCVDLIKGDGSIIQTGEQCLKIAIERRDNTQIYGNIQSTNTLPDGEVAAHIAPEQLA